MCTTSSDAFWRVTSRYADHSARVGKPAGRCAALMRCFRHPNFTMRPVPYVDVSVCEPSRDDDPRSQHGVSAVRARAGRLAARMAAAGEIDIVHGLGASVLGYATADSRRECARAARVQSAGARRVRRDRSVSRAVEAPWVLAAACRCAALGAFRRPRDRYRSFPRGSRHHAPGVSKEAVRVIPNAIEPADCDRPDSPSRAQALRAELGLQPDDVLLVSVGRLEANKGFRRVDSRAGDARAPEGTACAVAMGARRRRSDARRRCSARRMRKDWRRFVVHARPRRVWKTCTAGTRRRRCSSIRRCTKAARSSRSRPWRIAGRLWPAAREDCPTK